MRTCPLIAVLCGFVLSPSSLEARIIRVALDGDGSDGLSWGTAYRSISDGVDAASDGDEIWVHSGVYVEVVSVMTKTLTVLGGFSGNEDTSINQKQTKIENDTIVDGTGLDLPLLRVRSPLHIARFTFRNGPHKGLSVYKTSAQIKDCLILNNRADTDGGGGLISDATATFENCVISNNLSPSFGGGLQIENSHVSLHNCIIENNQSQNGCGISSGLSTVHLSGCIVRDNRSWNKPPDASFGGGILIGGTNLAQIENCLVYGNQAEESAQVHAGSVEDFIFTNCTISGDAHGVRGLLSRFAFENCILWGSSSLLTLEDRSEATVTNSTIQGGYTGVGNISDDPRFKDAAHGDFHLLPDSPCIDTAGTSGPSDDLDGKPRPVDIAGVGREGADAFDMGAYEFQFSDFPTPTPAPTPTMNPNSDVDQDGRVGIEDLLLLIQDWQKVSGQ